MTDAAFVFWSGALFATVLWCVLLLLNKLAQERKLTDRLADLERWRDEVTKKEAKK